MIRLNNIVYHYNSLGKNRVNSNESDMHFSLQIEQGERVVILGPSGAGKSTLLNLIAGFIKPISGEIRLNNQNMHSVLPGKRPVSMLFQENNLFEHLTVMQNVGLGIKPSLKLNKNDEKTVIDMLNKVGLEGMLDRYPHQLSGGQKQRVALARALIQRRPILLLDEPFSALDQALRFEMLALVNRICEEFSITLIMVSHYIDDTLKQFNRAIVINKGTILFDDRPAALYQSSHHSIAALLGITQ